MDVTLPSDLYAILRNRAKNKGTAVPDVIREALITAMNVEDGGYEERISQHEAKWNAEMEGMRAQLDAFFAQPPAAKAPADEAAPKSSEAA